MDCLIQFETPFGAKSIIIERTVQLSQRELLGDNPAWTEDALKAALVVALEAEVELAPMPAAEVAVLAAIEEVTKISDTTDAPAPDVPPVQP